MRGKPLMATRAQYFEGDEQARLDTLMSSVSKVSVHEHAAKDR